MNRIILHIDLDSFFASVEQQSNPLFRNRPLGVTATNGRTCIIASSREAKKLGIKTASRSYDARKVCPSIVLVPADFVKYSKISKKFIAICSDFSPTVEVFSIDEVFMDVSETAVLFGGVYALIEKFKERLKQELGVYITASVGISHNKLLAKLASGLKKPDGIMSIAPEDVLSVYQSSKLTDICGIGPRIKARLISMGVYTLFALRVVPLASLIAEFGEVEGKFLHSVGLAVDDRPVIGYEHVQEVKSVGRQYCLPYNEYDERKVLQNIYELCEEVALKLRRLGKKARTVGIYLGGENSVHGRQTFANYFDSGKDMFERITGIIGADSNKNITLDTLQFVRQISISVSNLEDVRNIPSPLFLRDQKQQKLIKTVDAINEKFGHHTIRNGFLINAPKLTTVPNGYTRIV